MSAFMFLATKRQDRADHGKFALSMLAQSEQKVIDKQVDRWEKEA